MHAALLSSRAAIHGLSRPDLVNFDPLEAMTNPVHLLYLYCKVDQVTNSCSRISLKNSLVHLSYVSCKYHLDHNDTYIDVDCKMTSELELKVALSARDVYEEGEIKYIDSLHTSAVHLVHQQEYSTFL